MTERTSPGARLRRALEEEKPLQVAGAINAYSALMADAAGFRAIYLSGAGVANASFGLPDLGMTNLTDVLEDARRITSATELPLLVDADTGFGAAFAIARTVREMERAGVASIHIEDQVQTKRCGHRPGKELVSPGEMADRVRAAVAAKTDPDFVVMARTDAIAVEGLDEALERVKLYEEAGADAIFAEAVTELDHYRIFSETVGVPILANITEFGKTPLFTAEELASAGVDMALYPLSAFRAANAAALRVFRALREEGTQREVVDAMQTREELYRFLDYEAYEKKLDELFQKERT